MRVLVPITALNDTEIDSLGSCYTALVKSVISLKTVE